MKVEESGGHWNRKGDRTKYHKDIGACFKCDGDHWRVLSRGPGADQ